VGCEGVQRAVRHGAGGPPAQAGDASSRQAGAPMVVSFKRAWLGRAGAPIRQTVITTVATGNPGSPTLLRQTIVEYGGVFERSVTKKRSGRSRDGQGWTASRWSRRLGWPLRNVQAGRQRTIQPDDVVVVTARGIPLQWTSSCSVTRGHRRRRRDGNRPQRVPAAGSQGHGETEEGC